MPEAGKQVVETGEPHVRVAPSFGFDPLMARDRVLGVSKEGSRGQRGQSRGERMIAPPISIVVVVSKGWNDCASWAYQRARCGGPRWIAEGLRGEGTMITTIHARRATEITGKRDDEKAEQKVYNKG